MDSNQIFSWYFGLAAITITLGWWVIPMGITILCAFFIIRNIFDVANERSSGWWDFGGIFNFFAALLWLLPVGFVWAIYFAILYFTK